MDFSVKDPKPEIIRNNPKPVFPPERHVVDRNKQDLLNFFNVSPKTRVAVTVSALGILLFIFSIFNGAFQNQTLDTLYPKEQSQASQNAEMHLPPETQSIGLAGPLTAKVSEPYEIDVVVHTGTESSTVIAAQVRFDPKVFEVNTVTTEDSIVIDWTDNNVSNTDGVISLVGSFPKGYIAKKGDNLAKVIMTPKVSGQTSVYIDNKNSHVYRLRDKAEVAIEYDKMDISIVN